MTCEHKRIPRIEILFFYSQAFSTPQFSFIEINASKYPIAPHQPLHPPFFPRSFELFHGKERTHNPSHAWFERKSLVYDRGESLILIYIVIGGHFCES